MKKFFNEIKNYIMEEWLFIIILLLIYLNNVNEKSLISFYLKEEGEKLFLIVLLK